MSYTYISIHSNVLDFCASLLYNTPVFLYDRVKVRISSRSFKKKGRVSSAMENTQLDGSQAKKNIDSVQAGIFWENKNDDAKYSFVGHIL